MIWNQEMIEIDLIKISGDRSDGWWWKWGKDLLVVYTKEKDFIVKTVNWQKELPRSDWWLISCLKIWIVNGKLRIETVDLLGLIEKKKFIWWETHVMQD